VIGRRDNPFPTRSRPGSAGQARVLRGDRRLGSVECVNAARASRSGEVPLFKSGINASVLVKQTTRSIAIYGVSYWPGQLIAIKIQDLGRRTRGWASRAGTRESSIVGHRHFSTSTSSPSSLETWFMSCGESELVRVDAKNR